MDEVHELLDNLKVCLCCLDCFNFLKHWRAHEKDSVRPPVVDILPCWILCIALALFCILIFTVILLGVVGVFPEWEDQWVDNLNSNETVTQFLSGTMYPSEITDLSGYNQELHVYFKFYRSEAYPFGFHKNDIRFYIDTFYYRSSTDAVLLYPKMDRPITRDLTCMQSQGACEYIHVEWLPFLGHKKYKFEVTLDNAAEMVSANLLSDKRFEIVYRYTNKAYTVTELVIRYLLFLSSGVNFLFFLVFTCFVQLFQSWLLEQRIVMFILFFCMLYNNPFFIFDVFAPGFVFPLLNIVFVDTFICGLMFTILTLSHAAIKRPEQRTFFGFYFIKFLLIFCIWVVSLGLLVMVRFEDSLNPTMTFSGHTFLGYAWMLLFLAVIVYLFNLGYYIFRAVGYWCKKKLPKSYSRRTQLMFFFSVIVVIGTVVNVVMMTVYGYENSGQALAFFIGYNAYCTVLCLFYLPAVITRKKGELRRENAEFGMEDDLADVEYSAMGMDEDEELEMQMEEERLAELRMKRETEIKMMKKRVRSDIDGDEVGDDDDESDGEVEQDNNNIEGFRGQIESEIRI